MQEFLCNLFFATTSPNENSLIAAASVRFEVHEVDLVRETTLVDVRYSVPSRRRRALPLRPSVGSLTQPLDDARSEPVGERTPAEDRTVLT